MNNVVIVCDMQLDALKSINHVDADSLVEAVRIVVSSSSSSKILFHGLQFPLNYGTLNPIHKLYGALKRLNQLQGDEKAHWFIKGYTESDIHPRLKEFFANPDYIFWRQTHLPSKELLNFLTKESRTHVTLVGIKTGYTIQVLAQVLVDYNIHVTIIQDAIIDDNHERHNAVVEHILPVYADIIKLEQFIDTNIGLETYANQTKSILANNQDDEGNYNDFCDCGRGGHFALYVRPLLERMGWRRYPLQHWYADGNRSYHCPLGKKVVSFCDEPQFSKISMYIAGREWLDEKDKVLQLASDVMPKTYIYENNSWYLDGKQITSFIDNDEMKSGPWFVKECNKNGGRAIQIYHTLQECEENISDDGKFVIQANIDNSLLTINNNKCHVKQYILLQCNTDNIWTVHTYSDAFLCVSPVQYNSNDLSSVTQITVLRHHRLKANQDCIYWKGWPNCYNSFKEIIFNIVEKAIQQGKLKGRDGKKQFEICSADFMIDIYDKVWLIEFNFGPVMYDPKNTKQPLTTNGLREYQRRYEQDGGKTDVNDSKMIEDAIQMVFFPQEQETNTNNSLWDHAGTFHDEKTV